MTTRSTPERLDEAVDMLLTGARPVVDPALRPLVAVAETLARSLRPVPASPRFEAALARRLAANDWVERAGNRVSTLVRQATERPGRLIAAGAVSSAAVGVTVTAFFAWRSTRRHPHRAGWR